VHDLSGNVLVYRRLAGHLGPDQPVYGFQYPDQHQQPLPALSIEQLAARYVDELLAVRPEGPYLLAGYSVGGAIAYEMARRLDAGGREVALLASFDGGTPDYPPGGLAKYRDHALEFLHRSPLTWAAYLRRRAGYRRARQGRPLTGYPGRAGIDALSPAIRTLATEILPRARAEHRPAPYAGRMEIFRCAEDRFLWRRRPDLGWGGRVLGGITVHDVPATHQSLMAEPSVGHLARILATRLERLADEPETLPWRLAG
jgi:thioesterase domain-containing protein